MKNVEEAIKDYENNCTNIEDLLEIGKTYIGQKNKFLIPELFFRKLISMTPEEHDIFKVAEEEARKIAEIRYRAKEKEKYSASDFDEKLFELRITDRNINSLVKKYLENINKPINRNTINDNIIRSGAFFKIAYNLLPELKDESRERIYSNIVKERQLNEKNKPTLESLIISNKKYLERIFNNDKGNVFKNISQWKGDDPQNNGRQNFINWYISKDRGMICEYCQCSILQLLKFSIKRPTRYFTRGHSWEIEHRIPKKGYGDENCALICFYCNNAKSDVFEWKEFEEIIGPAIGTVIRSKSKT